MMATNAVARTTVSNSTVDLEHYTTTQHRWRCNLSLTIRGHIMPADKAAATTILRSEIDGLEVVANRFRADSEISRVNRAAGSWTPVSDRFTELLKAALGAADNTRGLVTPTLAKLVDAAGYRIWRDPNSAAQLTVNRGADESVVHWQSVETGRSGQQNWVRLPKGCQLDFGATAKAWLADRVAELATAELGMDVVANMGGDLRAISSTGAWILGADPEIVDFAPAALLVENAGLATSSQGSRRWPTPTGPAHHIVDPRTGRSAQSRWWTVSVLAPSALAANASSTAGLILDDAAPDWLRQTESDAWLVAWDPSQASSPTAQVVGRWPKDCQAAA